MEVINKDQCREAFEAWLIQDRRSRISAMAEWTDEEIRGVVLHDSDREWAAWQAARSAPAAPVELPEPAAWLIARSAFRVSPHGQDAESNEWLEEAHEPGEEGSFRVYTEQQVRELLAAAPKLPRDDGWLPIESAPRDGTLIVVRGNNFNDSALGQHCCIAAWCRGCWMESSEWSAPSELEYLTHWMPLPQPPKEEG